MHGPDSRGATAAALEEDMTIRLTAAQTALAVHSDADLDTFFAFAIHAQDYAEIEAFRELRAANEDHPWTYDQVADLFEAIFERRPEEDDGDLGEILSHCYAAMPDEAR